MNILKQLNADAQENSAAENADVPTATSNAPVEVVAEEATATAPAEETPVQVAEVVAAPVVEEVIVETAHDDFDWSVDKRNISYYPEAERLKYESVYENTFVQIEDGQILDGDVVGVTTTDAVINIGFKSDGLISLNEFRDIPTLKT